MKQRWNAIGLLAALFSFPALGQTRGSVTAFADLTIYAPQSPAQDLIYSNDNDFVAPRLSLFGDLELGKRIRLHALANADRGFDPGMKLDGDMRLDEYYLAADVTDDVTVRIGKFATVFGIWPARHLALDDPFITAPVPYGNMVPISDQAAPPDTAAFAARRNRSDNKESWVPIIWGPSYATGASITTRSENFEFAVEAKSTGLSSWPDKWDAVNEGFDLPATVTARFAWHGTEEWTVGTSFSRGPYLVEESQPTLPPGGQIGDYDQTTVGVDVAYAHHRLQIWSELVGSRFEVPRVGNVATVAGYVEARYQLTPQVWLSGRWNQTWYDDVPGEHVAWGRDYRRLDVGVGYKYNVHLQTKLQFSLGDQAGKNYMGRRLFAWQTTFWL